MVAEVDAQPFLDGAAAGDRVRDRADLELVGAGAGADPAGGVLGGTDGVLPDTGAPALLAPLGLLGVSMVLAGAWILRRRRSLGPDGPGTA